MRVKKITLNIDTSHSLENEWLCLAILRAYRLPVPLAPLLQFQDRKVLAVERFDRVWGQSNLGSPRIRRLPQENIGQSTGTAPALKYESDRGEVLAVDFFRCSTVLDAGCYR